MADLLDRIGGWVRPPGQRHLTTFALLTAATQGEAVLSLLGTVALVRVAGTETSGKVFFAQSLAIVWFLLWDPKLDDAAQRFIPVHQTTVSGGGTWLFIRLLWLDVVINLLVAALGVGAVVIAQAAGWISVDPAVFLVLAAVAGGMTAADGTARAGFAVSGQLNRLGLMRLVTAALSFILTITALIMGGPVAYLAAAALAGLATTVTFLLMGQRIVVRAFGPPPAGPVPMPEGIVRFALKSSAAASVSAASDSGILTLAGLLSGPSLVTFLKVAGAPGRLLNSFVSVVGTQLYPRLASAVAERKGAAVVQRDVLKASTLLGILGVITVTIAPSMAGPLLTLLYGPPYAALATLSVILLAAACVRGVVVWAKVLPLALGRPGLRLAFVAGDGALLVVTLLLATAFYDSAMSIALMFGWGRVVVAVLGAVTWLALLRPLAVRS
jgi:O-antigen/teichoic acid export membrane protein